MGVINDLSYSEYLKQLLDNSENVSMFPDNLLLDLYLTLLSLSNLKYSETIYLEELSTIEIFLRKVNNLKVKIQLKRKETEIDELLNEIKELYENNHNLINKYNKGNLDVVTILDTKDATEITTLIDKLTKEKMDKDYNKERHDTLRNNIINNIFKNNHYLQDSMLYIDSVEGESIAISLEEFYQIFDYLLDTDNYSQVFMSNESNSSHTSIISNIIVMINEKKYLDKESLIPVILTYLSSRNIPYYNNVDTSKFNIDNIKITDLYLLAENNLEVDESRTAKWRKVIIPNEYLYQRIKEMVTHGMYYQQDGRFILEIIENNVSAFKISISINDMNEFLKANLDKITNQAIYLRT